MRDRLQAIDVLAVAAAWLVAAIGAASAAGWVFHIPELLEPRAGWGPTPINAAVVLAACGFGALGARGSGAIAELARLLGVGVVAVCCATLAETIFQIDFTIDPASIERWIASGGLHPGRMPPNTAIALGLAGAALAMSRSAPSMAGLFGGLSAAIGGAALLGYVTGVEPAHRWEAWPSMPPISAAALVLLGFVWWPAPDPFRRNDPLLVWRGPLVMGVATASITLLFWQALRARDERIFQSVVEAGAQRVETEIRAGIRDRTLGLVMLARESVDRDLRTRGGWDSDARLTLSESPGLIALEWSRADGTVKWRYPMNLALPSPRVGGLPRSTSRVLLSRPLELRPDTPGLQMLAPVRKRGAGLDGWIAATFVTQELFADILSGFDSFYLVEVSSESLPLFRSDAEASTPRATFAATRSLRFAGDLALDLRVEPSEELIASMRSELPPVLLACGLTLSALLALALGLRGVASARAHAHADALEEIGRLNAQLEARVRLRTAELGRSNEDLRQFASFLSHELRQPLGAQVVWADLLETKHGATLDEEALHCVEKLRAGATRMGELLDAQLSLAEGRRDALRSEDVPLDALAAEVTSELNSELSAVGAQVEQEPLPVVKGERAQLGQLIRNLLENAIKYRREDLPLRIRLSGRVEGENALLRVEDNGRGFPLAEAERIFEASVRLDPDAGPGDGLGLALCKQIAASHGGWIRARGVPGEGAVFSVLLPASRRSR